MDPAAFVLAQLPPPPARVLEIGCGGGELARALDAAGYDVVAVDPHAPDGPSFRRMLLGELGDEGPFDAAVARYSLHHIEPLDGAIDQIAPLVAQRGKLVVEDFGWDLVDLATAAWLAEQLGRDSADAALAEWRAEHQRLHRYGDLRRELDRRFEERMLEWQPYLHRSLERPELEAREREAVKRGEIAAIGFRYTGLRRN